jgi:hypothetical protein
METKEQVRQEAYTLLTTDKATSKKLKEFFLRHDAAESFKEERLLNNLFKMAMIDRLQKARSQAKQAIAAGHVKSEYYQAQLHAIEFLLKWVMDWKYERPS